MSENVIGDAYIKIHALTRDFNDQIKKSLKDFDKDGERAGDDFDRGFSKSLSRGLGRSGGGGRGGFFTGLRNEAEAARQRFQTLLRTSYVLGPVITGLVGGIGSLASAFVSLVSVLGGAIPALAVVATTFTAILQGAVVARIALRGVAEAIQAGFKAQKADNKEREGAEKRLTRARRNLAQAYEDSAKRLASADEAVAEAQERVNEAREQAREDLQQLSFDSEDAAIAEQRAAIGLEKARETLARVSDLPVNSRARKEAQLAFAEADLNFRRAIDRNSDLRKEVDKNASLGGIEQQIAGQKSVIEAEKNVADALENKNEVLLQNQRSEIAAKEAVQDAKQALDDASKSANAYEDALKDLSEEAQSFVRYVVSLREEFKKLRDAAGREFFPALERSLENLVQNLFPRLEPLFVRTGKALGFVALNLSDVITKGDNLNRLERVFRTNDVAIVDLGISVGNLYEAFLITSDIIRPLTEEFTGWINTLTRTYKETRLAGEATGELQRKFEIAADITRRLGRIFRNVFEGFGNLISANVGPGSGGDILLNYLLGLSRSFRELEKIDGKPIREFFADSAVVAIEVLGFLGDIIGAFIRLGDNPGVLAFVKSLRVVTGILEDIGNNIDGALIAFSDFLIAFAELSEVFTESGAIEIFFEILTAGLDAVTEFARSDLGQNLIKTFAPILAVFSAIGLSLQVISFFSKVALGGLLKLATPLVSLVGFLAGLSAPVLLLVGAIALVVGAIVGAYTQSEIFRNSIAELFQTLKDVFQEVVDSVNLSLQGLGIDGIKGLWEDFLNVLRIIGDFLGTYIVPFVGGFFQALGNTFTFIIKAIFAVIQVFRGVFKIVLSIFQGVAGLLVAIFTGNFDLLRRGFKNFGDGARDILVGIFKFFASAVELIINAFINGYNVFAKITKRPLVQKVQFSNIFDERKFQGDAKDRNPAAARSRFNATLPTDSRDRNISGLSSISAAATAAPKFKIPDGGLGNLDRFNMDNFKFSPINPATGTSLPGTSPRAGGGVGASASTVNITNNVYPAEKMNETELASLISRQIAFQLKQGAA